MSRPVIAVTSYMEQARWGEWDQPATLVPNNYVERVREAGARVVILAPDERDTDIVTLVDGLVLIGGPDVDATLYGQAPHAATDAPRTLRDASEIALYRRARECGLPVLGICRGLQLMAVAHGGSLIQHLPDLASDTVHHGDSGTYAQHRATLVPGSLVARLVGGIDIDVNSSHHQCVDDPGTLTVTGWADDGTIEVCEDPTAEFVLGVQWHPEAAEGLELFRALVGAAT